MNEDTSTIRILGIAPYEGMRTLMLKVAEQYKNIELTAFVGNRQEGVEIVEREGAHNYDAIISRGGTADMIAQKVKTPVISIKFSAYDVLCSLKLAENCNGRYAVIGFPAVCKDIRFLCESLQMELDIFTIYKDEEVTPMLQRLQAEGYSIFVSDTISDQLARKNGMNSILITSSMESVGEAFKTAIQSHQNHYYFKKQLSMTQAFFSGLPVAAAILDAGGAPMFTSCHDMPQAEAQALFDTLQASEADNAKIQSKRGDCLLSAEKFSFTSWNEAYTGYLCTKAPLHPSHADNSIQYFNRKKASDFFLQDFYGVSSEALDVLSAYNASRCAYPPMMIIGDTGTGKDQTAAAIYTQSEFRDRPFIFVDCQRLNDKSWSYLFKHSDSPLLQEHITIYFKHIFQLPDESIYEIIAYMQDSKLHHRNHLIFSCLPQMLTPPIQQLINDLYCLPIQLLPLRKRVNEIPTLCSLYISALNLRMVKQVIGFQPDATELMTQFAWPQNLVQLRRVITHAVSITEGAYVTAKSVQQVLAQETTEGNFFQETSLDMTKPLAEIELEIVKRVLAQCNNSQSKAAQQLQISRSTLWRMLKRP